MRKILFRPGSSRLNALLAVLLSAYAFASYPTPALAAIPQSEREALIAIYNSMGGYGWGNKTGWLDPPGSECSWYGVSCDVDHTTVTGLDLSNNYPSGMIPAEVADLANLQFLDLSGIYLTGSIPPGLGTLRQLRSLRLKTIPASSHSTFGLSGSIPAELGNLANLEVLDLGGNEFSGSIPVELGNLTDLKILDISGGFYSPLSGSIPSTLGNLRNLETLVLPGNRLSGGIPAELGNLTNLRVLKLRYNPLGGSIPRALSNLRNLETLDLSVNQLTGTIPAALGNLTSLVNLDLTGNLLNGNIPVELGNLITLQNLFLGENQLSGNIPPSLGNLTNLRRLWLSGNQLSGDIPVEFGNLIDLWDLSLGSNELSGSIPVALGNLTSLTEFDLSGNQLGGNIPEALGNLTSLANLDLSSNQLSGSIPPSLGDLISLLVLDLRGNQLGGSIPSSLGKLANLFGLYLSNNQLDGNIPPSLANLPNIYLLVLGGNRLNGDIPSTFLNLTDSRFDINYNALYTNDSKLKSFLDLKEPGWDQSQTVAPSQISAVPFSGSSVLLSWQPIPFSDFGGRYEVWLCTANGKPYYLLGSTTDKKASSIALNYFNPGTTYKLAMLTISDPTPSNQNTVTSDFSAPISFRMPVTSIDLTLNGAGAATSSTFGSTGPAQSGYAVTSGKSGSDPYATALFSYRRNGATVSEAAVPASPLTSSARFFVDYRENAILPGSDTKVQINTGFAVVNGGNAASLSFILRDPEGQIISRGSRSLDKNAHLAAYFSQIPDILPGFSIDPAFHFGTLEISSDRSDHLLLLLALRLTTNQRGEMLMTSTAVADLGIPSTSNPVYLPQFADGAGYSTSVALLNTSSAVETGVLQLLTNDGSPLTVREVNGTSASSFNYSIPPGGVFVLQTDASPHDVQTGWVKLTPDRGTSTPAGTGILQFIHDGVLITETGIPSVESTTLARIFLDTSGGHNTGIAIGNPGITPLNLSLQAFQMDGTTQAGVSNSPLTLDANGHAALFVDQLISGLPSGFQGVLEFSADSPFAAITYRSLLNERDETLLTAFPVADLIRTHPTPLFFPQIADGDGISTQFILLNALGPSSTTLLFFGESGSPLAIGKW